MALKIAIVGMGGIGHTHAACYRANPLAELVAVCDVRQDRREEAAGRYGVPGVASVRELLECFPEIDIVDVTTSGYENGSWHYVPTMEALDAGKHVLVEKPMSNDVREAREMVRLAAEKNVYLGCNLNHYFTDTAARGDQLIAEGRIGEPVYLLHKMGFNGGETSYRGAGSERWHRPYSHLKAFLAHPFSVMRHFGGDITHVQAHLAKPGVRKTADDLMYSINSIHLRFENGSTGYLLSQRGDAMFGLGGWWSFEMAGTRGTFVIENCVETDLLGCHHREGLDVLADPGRGPRYRHHRLWPDLPEPPERLPRGCHERRPARIPARLRPRCPGDARIHLRRHPLL